MNITTGLYRVVCDKCGYTSANDSEIQAAGQERQYHIDTKGCPDRMVFLEEAEDPVHYTEQIKERTEVSEVSREAPLWMHDCLNDATTIINKHTHDCEPLMNKDYRDSSSFFPMCSFDLFIQTDQEYAYGYIQGVHPYYRIGIHKSLHETTPENKRMVIIILVHELLHALYPNSGHDKINPLERLLANKEGYFDALRNMEILYLSGKMRMCG